MTPYLKMFRASNCITAPSVLQVTVLHSESYLSKSTKRKVNVLIQSVETLLLISFTLKHSN